MPVSANGTHIVFNDNSTQAFGFTGPVAAANITGQITAPQIAPGVIPSGGFSNMQVFTSPGTFTTPPTTTKIKVTVVGGGGGGSRLYTVACEGCWGVGGGGGGAAISVLTVAAATPFPVTVGTGGTVGPANGGTGGTSSFGSPAALSATGGGGGIQSGTTSQPGQDGGIGSGGNLNIAGGASLALVTGFGGMGGNSFMGAGGKETIRTPTGSPGRQYGGGGSSGTRTPGGCITAAGTGAAGVVIVEF